MIARFDICQGMEDWHRIKWGRIGGSSSKGLFVKSDTLLEEILAEHLEPFEMDDDEYLSKDMIRGMELEPQARSYMEQYIGVELMECGWLQCEEIDILGISPDGITEDGKIAVEIKCPGRKRHTKTLMENDIPSDNIHQCLHNFTVNPHLEQLYFVSYRPESEHPAFIKMLTRHSVIDLGTKAKPNCKPVSEWVKIAKAAAKKVEANIETYKKKLQNA